MGSGVLRWSLSLWFLSIKSCSQKWELESKVGDGHWSHAFKLCVEVRSFGWELVSVVEVWSRR